MELEAVTAGKQGCLQRRLTSSQCSQEPSSGGSLSCSSSASLSAATSVKLSSSFAVLCCSAAGALLKASLSRPASPPGCCGGSGCFGLPCCAACFGWSDQPVRRLLKSSAPQALRLASGRPLPSGRD